jgi:hypothetical protein
VREDTQEAQ